jgi:hypothetical protein
MMAASFRALFYAVSAYRGEIMPFQAKPTEEAISQLLRGNKELQPPANAKHETRLKDFDAGCKRAAGKSCGGC